MDKNRRAYEPPKMKIYQFDDNDQILTASGGANEPGVMPSPDPTQPPTPNYAANALNKLMGGTNTTIE